MKGFELTYQNERKKVYKSTETNKKGESIIIEISRCYYDNTYKKSLPNLWKKHGHTQHLYNSVIWVDCEVSDSEGFSRRKYEPTTKLSEDKHRNVINFDWMYEVSEENEQKVLNETIRRFKEAK